MYLSNLTIENFRCFGERDEGFELALRKGLTALVGENDSGKTAVIDAIRFALGTTDQDWYTRLEDTDFHDEDTTRQIRIVCTFKDLSSRDKRAFIEYLTYGEGANDKPFLIVNWTAKDTGQRRNGRPFRWSEVHSGKKGDGPSLVQEARELLRATYLRPLRDAEQALSAGRGSRLAQVLRTSKKIEKGEDSLGKDKLLKDQELSVLGIANLVKDLLEKQKGVLHARGEINEHLKGLALRDDELESAVSVSGASDKPDVQLRRMLEKLELSLRGDGKLGLGSNNLLFMACEFLLLSQENEGVKLLLIEEPEAHLHAQRQLQAMRYLQKQAEEEDLQVIVTTHSPNLASAINLNNIVMIHEGRAYPMAKGQTELAPSDYRFLQRFLDVTKANLFFARAVVIVEGPAENILLPTIARLLDRDFTEYGVSIVSVGGTGLSRYARIFQRRGVKDGEREKQLRVPVACLTDMDVMPNCGPLILGKVKKGDAWPEGRKWRVKSDFDGKRTLKDHREGLVAKAAGQRVKTFVSDECTLEYDLAHSGLAEDVYVAARLAKTDRARDQNAKPFDDDAVRKARANAVGEFEEVKSQATEFFNEAKTDGCTYQEVLACMVYAEFVKEPKASKAIAAQYLAGHLQGRFEREELAEADLRTILPTYITKAIDFVTGGGETPDTEATGGQTTDG